MQQKLKVLIHNVVEIKFYSDFFDEADVFSSHTNRYWDKLLLD